MSHWDRQPENPVADDDISLRWLIKSLTWGAIDSLRRNKVAAALATVTLVVLIVLAADSQFDGLPRYQELILPRLSRLESVFLTSLRSAGNSSGDWRLYFFENAHSQVRDIIRAAKLHRPPSHVGRKKHREFIRYYELLNLEFNQIRMQLRLDPELDYLGQLRTRMEEAKPIRDVWARWAHSPAS